MDKDAIYTKLRELLISEFQLDDEKVKPDSHLGEDLDLDSLDMVDFILVLEDYTNDRIDPGFFKDARTVQDLVDLVQPLWK